MNNQKNHFADYIESRPTMTPEQYRLVKHAWDDGFNKYRLFFNELQEKKQVNKHVYSAQSQVCIKCGCYPGSLEAIGSCYK